MKKFILITISALFTSQLSWAQVAYVVPKEADVNQEITLYVNTANPDCNCPNIANATTDVYLWSWKPSDPRVGNGTWSSSNEDLKMTNDGNGLYSFKMIPSQFYNIVDIEAFYQDNIHLLVKLKDGGSGGGTDKENKSADLVAEIDPVPGCVEKLCPFPVNFNQDDYFTLKYDNNKEEKPAMQNLAPNDVFVFARCLADGRLYEITPFDEVANNPNLQMVSEGNGIFTLTFIPEEFFPIPAGAQISSLIFVIRKRIFATPNDKTDGNAVIRCGCP